MPMAMPTSNGEAPSDTIHSGTRIDAIGIIDRLKNAVPYMPNRVRRAGNWPGSGFPAAPPLSLSDFVLTPDPWPTPLRPLFSAPRLALWLLTYRGADA